MAAMLERYMKKALFPKRLLIAAMGRSNRVSYRGAIPKVALRSSRSRRAADGTFQEIGWDEAMALVGERLRAIRSAHGPDAIGVYFGNPLVHNYSGVMTVGALVNAIGTRNRTSASSQDTAPRFAASYYLYGNTTVYPVPDLARTNYFLCIGANPVVSNGSFEMMATP